MCGINISYGIDSEYYYYYRGEKFFLELNTKNASLVVEELTSSAVTSIPNKSTVIEDTEINGVISFDRQSKSTTQNKRFYFEVEFDENSISNSEYISRLNDFNKMPNIVKASPCFKTYEGNKVGLTNKFYVKLKSKNDIDILFKYAKEKDTQVLGYNEYMPLWVTLSCTKTSGFNALELANEFHESGLFEKSEPAFIYHDLLSSPNDPYYTNQWGLNNYGQYGGTYAGIDVKAESTWPITTGSNVKTAIYDHGFEMNHPDLSANVNGSGFDAETNSSPSVVRGSHGTACAGIVGAVQNNNIGISGVSPNIDLVSISINLVFGNTPQQLANGFSWAWTNGVDVISNSWGGYNPSSIIEDAIEDALVFGRSGKGTIIVFAAGNENNTNIRYPGNAFEDILVVGAMSPCGERKNTSSCDGEYWWGSCYGEALDVVAPGVLIATTDRQGNSGYANGDYTMDFNGTSSACPYVAGIASLVLSVNPTLTVQEVNSIIEKSTQKVGGYSYLTNPSRPNGTWHNEMGYGLVNAYESVINALTYGCQASLDINHQITSSQEYQTSSFITSSSVIDDGLAVSYKSGSIELNTGFYVSSNFSGVFSAITDPCSPSSIREGDGKYVFDYSDNFGHSENGEEYNQLFKVSPNPSNGEFIISLNNPFNGVIQVVDVLGRPVLEEMILNQDKFEMDLQSHDNGVYLVRLISGEYVHSSKIIKH